MALEQKRWKIEKEQYSHFHTVDTKLKGPLTVGFEYEVPFMYTPDRDMSPREQDLNGWSDTVLDVYSHQFADRYGYGLHGECGGSEFTSPVFKNIATAKAFARKLDKRMRKDKYADLGGGGNCGIHVHTSVPAGKYSSTVILTVWAMLNRESSSQFMSSFSCRDACDGEYYQQGNSLEWDSGYSNWDDYQDAWGYEGEDQEMVRLNNGGRTIEYRIWGAFGNLLVPAIEFSHACTLFAAQWDEPEPPYLKDMKAWVMKQRGYPTLKKLHEWSYV